MGHKNNIFVLLAALCILPMMVSLNFGPYKMKTHSISNCLSAKYDEELKSTWKMSVSKCSRTEEQINGFVYLPKDLQMASATVIGLKMVNGGFKPYYKISTKKPCGYTAFQKILTQVVKIDAKACIVKAGNHTVQDLNADKVVHWFGRNNFYSRQLYELSFESAKGSVFCLRIDVESKPLA